MKQWFLFALLLLGGLQLEGQPFRNLGFEEVNTNTASFSPVFTRYPAGVGPASDLLPGWQLFEGTNLLPTIGYDAVEFGPNINLVSSNAPIQFPNFSIEGKHALLFGSAADPIALVQQGNIPAGAQFLTFSAPPFGGFGKPIELSLNGSLVSSRGENLFDVSSFAAQRVELRFLFDRDPNSPRAIDNIQFVIPEPESAGLAVLGGLVLTLYRFRRSA